MGNTTPDFLIYLFLLGCAVMFFVGLMNGPKPSSKPKDWDMFTIGTIKPEKPAKVVYVNKPVKQPAKQAVTTKPQSVAKHPLYNDAINAMVSLGEKKSTAKTKADALFARHNPKDLNEVITLVFKQ